MEDIGETVEMEMRDIVDIIEMDGTDEMEEIYSIKMENILETSRIMEMGIMKMGIMKIGIMEMGVIKMGIMEIVIMEMRSSLQMDNTKEITSL